MEDLLALAGTISVCDGRLWDGLSLNRTEQGPLEEPKLTVSIGIASYPKDAETIGPLLYAADNALYSMKSLR